MAFVEVAAEVYVRREAVLEVNSSLVVGEAAALAVDTLSTDAQARELLADVRAVTALPLVLVNTHFHFDHVYGNGVLAEDDTPIWAHDEAARALREEGEYWQRRWHDDFLARDRELADGLAAVRVRLPDRTLRDRAAIELGGRVVDLAHLGRGHTDGDVVVSVPDAAVLLAGDLVETAGPPGFGDAYPLEWPDTLAAVLHLTTAATVVVPGHGRPVGVDAARAQHDELTALAWLIREGHASGATVEAVAAKAPFDRETSLVAVSRGYAELAGLT
jgi:glyoxylase-like metal-dependent hydrolase (beta-lactamase superfamily II)